MFASKDTKKLVISLIQSVLGFVTGSYFVPSNLMPTDSGWAEKLNQSIVFKFLVITLLVSFAASVFRGSPGLLFPV